jgi:hypothetical protein
MLRPSALCLLLLLPAIAAAQDPPKPTPASIDQLIERVLSIRKQRADLDKQEAAAVAELKARQKELQDKLDQLGLNTPPAPPPDTRLRDKLKTALDLDKGQKADVTQLAAVYDQAATVAGDKTITTTSELISRVRAVSDGLLGDNALFNLRVAVGEELLAAIGMTSDEPITDAQRKRAADLWRNTAAILKELAK